MSRRWRATRLFWRGVVAAVGGVGIVSGLYPLAPQIGLALARRVRGRPQPPGLLRVIASEWALSSALQALRPAAFVGPVLGRQARGPRPVIVLHGYAQGSANFLVLAHRLRRRGLGPILGFEYWTLGRLERAARRLGRFLDRLGAPEVDLVGHSMGGVVARYYVCAGGGGARVRNLVTVGSPHGGSAASRFGVGWPRAELRAGSEVLSRLRDCPVPSGVRATCIWSRADGLVSSRAEATLPGAEEIVYDDLGHMGLLASRRVARELAARLSER
jgi:hypothetical protein